MGAACAHLGRQGWATLMLTWAVPACNTLLMGTACAHLGLDCPWVVVRELHIFQRQPVVGPAQT